MFNVYKSYLWDLFWLIPSSFLALFLFYMNNLSGIVFFLMLILGYGWQFKTILDIKRNYPDEKILFIHYPSVIFYSIFTSIFTDILLCGIIPGLINYMNYSLTQNIYTIVSLFAFCFLFLILIIGIFSIQILTNKRLISNSLLNIKKASNMTYSKKNILVKNIKRYELKIGSNSSTLINIYDNSDKNNCFFVIFFDATIKRFCNILNNLLEDNKEEKI